MKAFVPTTIMVIGNDAHLCYLLQRYVKESGHQIEFSLLTNDVSEVVHKNRPAAIVLEVDLPNTIGWDVLRSLKKDQALCNIPVVLCSWLDEERRGLEEGADIYMRMPILYHEFLAALSAIGIAVRGGEFPGG